MEAQLEGNNQKKSLSTTGWQEPKKNFKHKAMPITKTKVLA
jgi:hypothetical protein